MTPEEAQPFLIAICICSFLLIIASLHLRKKYRLLKDLPTSKVQGTFIGLVELKGTAESDAPLKAYLSNEPCVLYSWKIEERWSRIITETYKDSQGKPKTRTRTESGWVSVADGSDTGPFFLKDDTGKILIEPYKAKIEESLLFFEEVTPAAPLYYIKGPNKNIPHSDKVRRFSEKGIRLHENIYVVGTARERNDTVAAKITHDRNSEIFLISTNCEENIRGVFSLGSRSAFILALLLPLILLAIGSEEHKTVFSDWTIKTLCGLAIFWMILWGLMVFNGLVQLRNRVRKGHSLIDIQLMRRHDLIPPLLKIVSEMADHEQRIHELVGLLRNQQNIPAQSRVIPISPFLNHIIEDYPEIKAQRHFALLHDQLVETEQRITLARNYYNEIATHFSTRIQSIPEYFVARLLRMKPFPLFTNETFDSLSKATPLSAPPMPSAPKATFPLEPPPLPIHPPDLPNSVPPPIPFSTPPTLPNEP